MKNTIITIASVAALVGSANAQGVFWGLDEEDSNRIYGWSDYTNDSSAVDHGRFFRDDGDGDFEEYGSNNIEAMALSDTNIGYLLGEDDHLAKYDFNNLTPGASNIYNVTTINEDLGFGGEGLAFNRLDGLLYLAEVVGDGDPSDTEADNLRTINPMTGVVSLIGEMSGLGEKLTYTDGFEINHITGQAYGFDRSDGKLYEIDLTTAAIIAVLDDDVYDGLSDNPDIESLAYDGATNRLLGIDNNNQEVVHITLENGNNSVLSNFEDHLGDGVDFEGTGIIATVPEPSSTALLSLGALGLLVRRKR